MLEQIQQYGSIRTQGVGRSPNAERLRALSQLGQKVGDIAFNIGAKARVKEGKAEGAKAGSDAAEKGVAPEERKGLFPTIYGDAFNNAQQGAYLASVDRQAVERLSELEAEFSHDADGYEKSAKGLLKGALKNTPETYRQALNESISGYVSRGTMRVNKRVAEQGNKEAKSELINSIDTYNSEASRAARNGDFDAVDDLLGKAQLSASAMVSGGFWTKEQADQTVMGAKKEIYRQENKRDILDTAQKNPDKAIKMLTDLEKSVPENHTPDEWERVVDDIRTDLSRIIPKNKSGATAKKGNDWLRRAKESLKFGFKLSDTDKAEGAALISGTDKQDDYVRLMKMEQFSLLPSKQRNNILGQMSGADNLDSQKDYIELQAVHNKLTKMAEEDGMTLAKRQGRLEPASMEGGDITRRNEQAEELSELYGTTVGPYMESEIQEFVAKMPDMTPSEKADLAMSIGDNERTYQQLDKKNASVFAMLSARGDQEIAKAVFHGEELIKTKQFKLPSKDDYSDDINEYLGEVGEIYGVEDRATIISAAKNYYATIGEEEYDDSSMEKALLAVTGGIGDVNGRKVELPEGVDEDDLDDFYNEISPEIIDQFGGLFIPYEIDDIRDGNLVSIGKNRYALEIEGQRQYNKAKEQFEITITPELLIMQEQGKKNKWRAKQQLRIDKENANIQKEKDARRIK